MRLRRLLGLFRRAAVRIPGAAALPEGQARVVDLGDPRAGGRQIVLARKDGRLFALDARCPHEGGRLVGGPLFEGRYAICPLHHYRFDVETGRPWADVCARARTYEVRALGDDAEVVL